MSLSQTIDTTSPPADKKPVAGFWERLDAHVERIGDRINPILVKESRQALKSKQFTITFGLLLICGWGWSLISCGLFADRLDYGGASVPTFVGYFIILDFPVLVMVPFAAFLSLVAERDEGTFELLSITSLSSGQIVRGKLGSAFLQMMVYFSAIAPCIVFTYLLRGLDILTIAFVLMHTFFGSLLLSGFGLLLATLTRAVHARVLLSGIFIIALAIVAFTWMMGISEGVLQSAPPVDNPDFWIANLAMICAMLSFLVLFISAAAAQISFASDNRSTRVRRIMFGQQALFIGWMAFFIARFPEDVVPFYIAATLAGIYWAVTGSLMTGELAELSPRVQRSLPRTALGRILLTWFNPGSGTGYVFAVANLATVILTLGIFGEFTLDEDLSYWWNYALAMIAYLAIYLGLGRLVIMFARRYIRFGAVVGFLIQAIVISLGSIIPATLQLAMFRIFGDDYTPLQWPNWFWTLLELGEQNSYSVTYIDSVSALLALALVAVPMMLVNLAVAAKEVAATRIAAPVRVMEEELEKSGAQG